MLMTCSYKSKSSVQSLRTTTLEYLLDLNTAKSLRFPPHNI